MILRCENNIVRWSFQAILFTYYQSKFIRELLIENEIIWIASFGDYQKILILVISLRSYGTFGRIKSKIYTNKASDPQEILRVVEVEAKIWTEAQQLAPAKQQSNNVDADWVLSEESTICFVNGAWRIQDKFSGQG